MHFARHLPALTWLPSDPDPAHRASVAAWTAHEALTNVLPPVDLDASTWPWPIPTDLPSVDVIYCANVIHISPWSVTKGLIAGAARLLSPGGALILYGPFKLEGRHTSPSNEAFDASLRSRNPDWGVRDLSRIATRATRATVTDAALTLIDRIPMPANNQTVVFRRLPPIGAP